MNAAGFANENFIKKYQGMTFRPPSFMRPRGELFIIVIADSLCLYAVFSECLPYEKIGLYFFKKLEEESIY